MSDISAAQWGSPLASRRALLIHGITGSSDSWLSVAQLLAREGFFVIAPNLLGHAGRGGSDDYRMSALAEDLQPYLDMHTYDVIIGFSLGGTVALSLLPLLPKEKEATVILVDPPLELSKRTERERNMLMEEIMRVKTVDEFMTDHPAWSRLHSVTRLLGLSMCDRTVVESIFQHNQPWSFSDLFKNIPSNVNITVLVADPKLCDICHVDHIPCDIERLDVRVVTGVGHSIPFERPGAIMDAIPLPT